MRHLVPLLLALGGCNDPSFTAHVEVDGFEQRPDAAVDWLFVVDDSCSMASHQQRLADHFDTLVSQVLRYEVDLHMAVVTTDAPAEHGRLQGQVLTPDMEDAAARFRQAVDVGTSGSGLEMGLESSILALTEPTRSGANAGFLREDSKLVVLYVSDEDDLSPRAVGGTANALRHAIGSAERDAVTAHALVVLDEDRCPPDGFEGAVGRRYARLAEETGGLALDLCADDLDPALARLSLRASGLTDTFILSDIPTPASLEVEVDGGVVSCGDGWEMVRVPTRRGRDGVGLRFDPVPPQGTRIVARYRHGSSLPEGPCE